METLKTAIEFVSTGGSGQEGGASAASTGDPLLIVCAIAVILCIGGFLFAFMQRKKAYIGVTGSHIKSPQFNQNRFNMITVILSAIIALSVCGIICSFTTHNAIADNNASDMVSNKITATVDNNTGSVSIEDAYIQNSTDNRILFKTVKIAKTEADGDCTYTLKLDGNEIFKDKADVEKTFDDPIVTTNKQTLHLDTDMSPDIAKSFIGKTPLSIEYVFDKDKEASPQKRADAESEITKDAEDTKKEIDGLNLTPEQKEELKKSIDEVLDNTKTAIENAKWESEVDQAKKDGEKQIQGILNNAKAQSLVNTKTETKEQVNSETQQAYDAIKEIANLSENEKGIFNSEIKEIKSATDSNINNAKTEEEVKDHLQVFENNIEEITTKAEEKALANLESAKESANELIEESSTTTKDQIDMLNLDDEKKLEYNNRIDKEVTSTKTAIESRNLITEVEKDKADFKKKIEDIFAEAKAQALIHTKDETKDAVDEESSSGKEYINNMDNLYDSDKSDFTERIETALSICKAGVDAAETENNVVAIHEKFQETLRTIEEEAASKASLNLSNKKAAATDDVIGKTNTAKNSVDLLNLPGSVKTTAKANIEKLSSDSQTNINNASKLSEVDELFDSFKDDLERLVDEYTELQNSYHSVNVGSSTLDHGSFSTDAEDDLGKEDAIVNIVYTPAQGQVYTIDEVKVTTAEGEITVKVTGRNASFTMPKGDVTVIVTEIQGYTVTVNNDGYGDASADIDIAKKGATVQLTANPHQGYEFDKWESSDVEISSDNTFDMPEKNVSITAVFKAEAQKRFLAVYDSNATLTFFYDNQPHLSDNSIQVFWDLPTNVTKENDWPYQTTALKAAIKKINFDKSMKQFNGLESTAYMCANMKNAEDIEGLENLDTSNVKNMSYMFNNYGKSEINYLDLSTFIVNSSMNIDFMLEDTTIKSFSLGPNWKDKTMKDAGLREIDWYKLPDGTEALKPAQIPGSVLTEKTTYSDTKPVPPVTPDYCAINIVDEEATAENPATLNINRESYGLSPDPLLNLQYKIKDKSNDWIDFKTTNWKVEGLIKGDIVYLKGNNFENTENSHAGFSYIDTDEEIFYINNISVNKKFSLSGEATTLVYGDITDQSKVKSIPADYCFYQLFRNDDSSNLMSINSNFLPFTDLSSNCYGGVFSSCSSLISIPENLLPATTLAESCYYGMFLDCTSLESIPENLLPATTLKESCYNYMFSDCASLESIPENLLKATILAKSCYKYMFDKCSGLKSIPENLLKVEELKESCYASMFKGCSGLTSIPEGLLPGKTLVTSCYDGMFMRCAGLTSIPENLLPAVELAETCYSGMFAYCNALTSIPENLLPAEEVKESSYANMFLACTGLTSIPGGLLPASKLDFGCYQYMFSECTGLTSLPEKLLTATNLSSYCYLYMFNECSNLKLSNEAGDYVAFECPDYGSAEDPTYNMFGGVPDVKTTPVPYDKYYCNNPAPPVEWTPMTATSGDGQTINFYPAFKNATEITGYEFSVNKDGSSPFTPKSMYEIFTQLQSTGKKILYYKKTKDDAPVLKCYTTIDMTWTSIFQGAAKVKASYTNDFVNKYINNGIYTAELGARKDTDYGKYWDATKTGAATNLPTLNTVTYRDFWNAYGTGSGILMPSKTNYVWGSCAQSNTKAFIFSMQNNQWTYTDFIKERAVALAKTFE